MTRPGRSGRQGVDRPRAAAGGARRRRRTSGDRDVSLDGGGAGPHSARGCGDRRGAAPPVRVVLGTVWRSFAAVRVRTEASWNRPSRDDWVRMAEGSARPHPAARRRRGTALVLTLPREQEPIRVIEERPPRDRRSRSFCVPRHGAFQHLLFPLTQQSPGSRGAWPDGRDHIDGSVGLVSALHCSWAVCGSDPHSRTGQGARTDSSLPPTQAYGEPEAQ